MKSFTLASIDGHTESVLEVCEEKMPTATKATHTPGPWRICDKPGDFTHHIVGPEPEGIRLAEVEWQCRDNWKANARLVAAAPQLLEALEAMVPCDECKMRGIPNTAKFNWPKCDRCIKAEAAIRKARGEQ